MQDLTLQDLTSVKGLGLRGSAVCTNTRWEICPTCKPSDWDTFPKTGDRLGFGTQNIGANEAETFFINTNGCNVNDWFGIFSLSTLVFVTSSLLYWIFSLNKRMKIYDEAAFNTANYSIEVTVRRYLRAPNVEINVLEDWLIYILFNLIVSEHEHRIHQMSKIQSRPLRGRNGAKLH